LTALVAIVGVWFAVAASRRDARRLLPLVEPYLSGSGHDSTFGDFLKIKLWVVNRLDETLIVEKILIKSPPKSRISMGDCDIGGGRYQGEAAPKLGETNFVLPNAIVHEKGAISNIAPSPSPGDRQGIEFYLVTPVGWKSGVLCFEVFVSSKAETIRNKRVVVKYDVKAATATKTDATASKAA
jgi:hypothetical protein